MHPNETLLHQFYTAFQEHNPAGMSSLYHKNIIFKDPAFGSIRGARAKSMWHMLIERSGSELEVSFSDIQADDYHGSAKWTATYFYGPKKRKVVNHVVGVFSFQNGSIIQHNDYFDLYTWSKQALGLPGYLLGWTKYMQQKIQSKTSVMLSKYMQDHNLKVLKG